MGNKLILWKLNLSKCQKLCRLLEKPNDKFGVQFIHFIKSIQQLYLTEKSHWNDTNVTERRKKGK